MFKRKLCKILVLILVLSMCMSSTLVAAAADYSINTSGYKIEKISHPDKGEGEVDGILPYEYFGEEMNRNQSYTWSMIEFGDYVYIGTCWNPISGIYYRNVKDNVTSLLVSQGMPYMEATKKASELAKALVNVLSAGDFPDGATATTGTPMILRVNKYTGQGEPVYVEKEVSNFINWNGYRMTQVYKGKLYFVCAGFPTSRLIEINPEDGTSNVVLQKLEAFQVELEDQLFMMINLLYLCQQTVLLQMILIQLDCHLLT